MGGLTGKDMQRYFTPARRALLKNGWQITLSPGMFKVHETFTNAQRSVAGDDVSAERLCEQEGITYDE